MQQVPRKSSYSSIPVRSRSTIRKSSSTSSLAEPIRARSLVRSVSGDLRPSAGQKRSLSAQKPNIRPTTPSSARKFDDRPISDKNWQKAAFIKVVKYFEDKGITAQQLRLLNTPTFVKCTNILLKEIDDLIEITADNYKFKVVEILKLLSYPGQISLQLMNSIGTPHTFPRILAIWTWLIEQNQMLNRNLRSYFTDTSKYDTLDAITTYIAAGFMKTKPEIAVAELRKAFESIANYDEKEVEKLQQIQAENEVFREELKELENKALLLKSQTELNQKKVIKTSVERKKFLDKLNHNREGLQKSIVNKDIAIKNSKETCAKLENEIKKQKYTKKDLEELKQKIEDAEYRLEVVTRRSQNAEKWLCDNDAETAKFHKTIRKRITELNDVIKENVAYNSNLNKLLISEEGIQGYLNVEVLDKIAYLNNQFMKECDEELKKYKNTTDINYKETTKTNSLKEELLRNKKKEKKLSSEFPDKVKSYTDELKRYEAETYAIIADIEENRKLPDGKRALAELDATHERELEANKEMKKICHDGIEFLKTISSLMFDLEKYCIESINEVICEFNQSE